VSRPPRQRTAPPPADAAGYRPLHPYWVLLIAILLPGMGQVVNNNPPRGLMMAFSILALGWVSWHLTTPDQSLIGRYAGGLFVYAVAVLDAYRWARYRWEFFRRKREAAAADSAHN
jgi:hypothetical protein